MRVCEVMTEGVPTVTPSTRASDAWDLMRRHGGHHLVVTIGADIVGVLSERDTGPHLATHPRIGQRVVDYMTSTVVTVRPTDTIPAVSSLVRGRTIGCLPVVDHGQLLGIVTMTDLLLALARNERPAKVTRPSTRIPSGRERRTHAA